ncbi:5-methylcytosine-specific restriction enzyme subunit McrC [Corynebacterium atrinae]|uniref:5-methylcytosine-specific restriction endonuclease system specificity protein McrC n=1 Tax=Corynebacterium atrinae TaxID=1336740 RepID=UPI0025B4A976|nr:5-methylcytosine-specific restriction endonuclease system specificity protein McrC [Corynebacterium atrinae]WJY64024.1 5-methylcytosine-specific restriction enzyme subunit McrC [Corynebacterium atrinae]
MASSSVSIRNVYVMMAYAFRAIRSEGHASMAAEPFEHLHDLFSEILVRGVGSQVKRGIHRDYLHLSDELPTVRGRIDIAGTVATRSAVKGRLVCEFDEYRSDTPHNQALKSIIVFLIRHGDVDQPRRDALRRLLPYLDEVSLVAPRSIRWEALTYHRANANYRLLLGVCELVVRGLLPTNDPGSTKLASWISDEAMNRLYERFLLEYYAFHHPELSPSAPSVAWDYDDERALGAEQLPTMYTDVTLRNGQHTLIIDAKFYSQSMQMGRWNKATVHSSHLYQMLSYVKNSDVDRDGSVSGLVLYARTDAVQQPDLDITVQGNRIGAQTLDLNRPWEHLATQLEHVLTWLEK